MPGGALRVELIEEAATSGMEQFNEWDFKSYRYFFVMCPRHQGSFTMRRTLSAPDSMKLSCGALSGPVQVVQVHQAAKGAPPKSSYFAVLYIFWVKVLIGILREGITAQVGNVPMVAPPPAGGWGLVGFHGSVAPPDGGHTTVFGGDQVDGQSQKDGLVWTKSHYPNFITSVT